MLPMIKALFKSSTPVKQTAEEAFLALQDRTSAEIAARLLRRAELFEASSDDFLKRCAALDKVAAAHMQTLVSKDPKQVLPDWQDRRNLCLQLLREGKN